MVLGLKVPEGSGWMELKPLIPAFFSYLMSFIFIGIYWGNHHHLLHSLKNVTSGIIWANLDLLFWLSLIPFATGWMGENHFAPDTVMVYAILLLFCGVAFAILQTVVERHLQDSEALKAAFSIVKKKEMVSTIGYASAIPLAYINPIYSGIIFFIIAFIWVIPDKNIEKALTQDKEK